MLKRCIIGTWVLTLFLSISGTAFAFEPTQFLPVPADAPSFDAKSPPPPGTVLIRDRDGSYKYVRSGFDVPSGSQIIQTAEPFPGFYDPANPPPDGTRLIRSTDGTHSSLLPGFDVPEGAEVLQTVGSENSASDCATILRESVRPPVGAEAEALKDPETIVVPVTESFVGGPGGHSCGRIISCLYTQKIVFTRPDPGSGSDEKIKESTSLPENQIKRELKEKYPYCLVYGRTGTEIIQNYIKQIYRWSAGLVGIVCVLIIIISGIQITISGAGGEDQSGAKDRIKNALFGLVILFLSAFILYTINPVFFG